MYGFWPLTVTYPALVDTLVSVKAGSLDVSAIPPWRCPGPGHPLPTANRCPPDPYGPDASRTPTDATAGGVPEGRRRLSEPHPL